MRGPVVRGILVGLVGGVLAVAVGACGPALADEAMPASGSQAVSTVSGTPARQESEDIVWGRVPYCNCLVGAATANVASALKDANLTVSLKELSPRDGWLYFVATFDPHSVPSDQVGAAIEAGGGEVVEGPP